MEVKVLKDFKWSYNGRVSNYKAGQVIEVDSKNAMQMIKHNYTEEVFVEGKMFKHESIEDKMMHVEIEDKSFKSIAKKSKKSKEVEENE